jgi:hypothetical protein
MSNEYTTFLSALRRVLQVSHSEMKDRLAAEKKAKVTKPRPRVSSSRRACGDKG